MNQLLSDPFKIRSTASQVVKKSQLVSINQTSLTKFSQQVSQAIHKKQLLSQTQFGRLQNTCQKVFLLNTVNFCFWAKKNQKKWTVESPSGKPVDGWEALVAVFDRALAENTPLLNCQFLINLDLKQGRHIFRSANQTQIPLFKTRLKFLQQAGFILKTKFKGDFHYLLQQADFKAINIIQLVIKHFPSFNDRFYKRAQICAYDLSLLPEVKISGLDQLTVFADYKLPQILRSFGVLNYQRSLAKKIDNLILIPKNSQEEIEIRAATIWVGELLAFKLQQPPCLIDNAIWHLSQTYPAAKPYHRTSTTNY
ncbi:MAG: hypothetical protein NTZ93_01080 [Candidatus Beckwithbacteria bacterium]|nr:hypothetical protein [Candidatus Beckwithbacteria bacterium]